MIVEFLCNPFVSISMGVISLLPLSGQVPNWVVDFFNLVNTACLFIPVDVWIICLSNIVFWLSIHVAIGVFRFIYSIIPFA